MKAIRLWLINYLTRTLLKAVTADDVLLISGKDWIVNKHKLSREEILALKEEAVFIRQSTFWKLAKLDLKYAMTLQRYDQAKTNDDMMFGKAMAYDFSLIQKYMDRISTL